jgi:hypothetical protein
MDRPIANSLPIEDNKRRGRADLSMILPAFELGSLMFEHSEAPRLIPRDRCGRYENKLINLNYCKINLCYHRNLANGCYNY